MRDIQHLMRNKRRLGHYAPDIPALIDDSDSENKISSNDVSKFVILGAKVHYFNSIINVLHWDQLL